MKTKTHKDTGKLGPAEQFREIFRAEHRQVRDALLDLVDAFRLREKSRIAALLSKVARYAGPHFRYEEESLYPALVEFFGKEYVQELFRAHDRIIRTANDLVAIARKEELTEADVSSAIGGVRSILPHVSDCDGLSIMVEKFPAKQIRAILETRDASQRAGLDLLTWAAEVRQSAGERLT